MSRGGRGTISDAARWVSPNLSLVLQSQMTPSQRVLFREIIIGYQMLRLTGKVLFPGVLGICPTAVVVAQQKVNEQKVHKVVFLIQS